MTGRPTTSSTGSSRRTGSSATLDADARRQLRDVARAGLGARRRGAHPRGRPGRLPLHRRRRPSAGRDRPTTTATRSGSPRSAAATSSARWRSSPTGPGPRRSTRCATRSSCASRPRRSRSSSPTTPSRCGCISTEMVDRLLRSQVVGRPSTPVVTIALLPLGPEPSVREFGERLERSLARLTGSARRSRRGRRGAGDRRRARGPSARALVQRPRDRATRSSSTSPTPSRRRGPVRAYARRTCCCSSPTRPRRPAAARARTRREREPRGRAQPDRARARPPGVDRGPARHRPRGSRPATCTATTTSGSIGAADADRVARLVLSRGIGVVYSGGGARGIAELGVLRALREAERPDRRRRAARASARSSPARP